MTTSYKNDETYKTKLQDLQKKLDEFREEVKATSDSNVLSDKANALREHVLHRYHEISSYLKESFDIDKDDVAYNKLQALSHKLKEKGLDLKANLEKKANKATS